jgi:hypothetical protein
MFMVRFLILCLSLGTLINLGNCEICDSEAHQNLYESANRPCFEMGQYEFNLTKKVEELHDVELECYVRNKAAYSVIWMYNNDLISLDGKVIKPDPNIKLDTDLIRKFNLRLERVSPEHQGSYKCQIATLTAQDLKYDLDVLVAPSIQRSPSPDIITLSQGETLRVQCLASGNPAPHLTWTKRGNKAEHTSIDESKSELILEDVDQSHADTYSCTANNEIGNPVTSEFKVVVKFTPVVSLLEQNNVKDSVLYTEHGQKAKINFLVDAYPMPELNLFRNDVPINSDSYLFKESQPSGNQFIVAYTFDASIETFGEYKLVAENELGMGSTTIEVTPGTGEVNLKLDNFPVYSDAVLFEWSALSGSPVKELNVQYFNDDNINGTNKITKTHKVMPDGTELPPSYVQEAILIKDFYELTHLLPNTTYTIRLRVKNTENEWSDWSNTISVKTHKHHAERKHKPHSFHHKYHARKQHHIDNSNLRYNSYLNDSSSLIASIGLLAMNFVFIKFFFNY